MSAALDTSASATAAEIQYLRKTVETDISSLRRGLATVAEVLRAVRPALHAEVEQRAEVEDRLAYKLEAGLTDLRDKVLELTPLMDLRDKVFELTPLMVLRPHLADLSALASAGHGVPLPDRFQVLDRRLDALEVQLQDYILAEACAAGAGEARDAAARREAERSIAAAEAAAEGAVAAAAAEGERRWREAVAAEADARCKALCGVEAAAARDVRAAAATAERAAERSAECMAARTAANAAADTTRQARAKAERGAEAQSGAVARAAAMAYFQEVEGRLIAASAAASCDLGAELRAELVAAAGASRAELAAAATAEARSAARGALGKATHALSVERQRREAAEEALGTRIMRSEERLVAEGRRQEVAVERLSDAVTRALDITGAQLADLAASGAADRQRADALQSAERQLAAAGRQRKAVDESAWVAASAHELTCAELQRAREDTSVELNRARQTTSLEISQTREELDRHMREAFARADARAGQLDHKVRDALVLADTRLERRMAEAVREQRRQERAVVAVAERVSAKAAKTAEAAAAAEAEALWHHVKEAKQRSTREHGELQEELSAFMDEQRIFCGFLDTEQRSYKEIVRQELATLSQLVGSGLLGNSSAQAGARKVSLLRKGALGKALPLQGVALQRVGAAAHLEEEAEEEAEEEPEEEDEEALEARAFRERLSGARPLGAFRTRLKS